MDSQTAQTSLTTSTILVTILGSSVLAAGLTTFFDYVFNNINYKKEYYKSIITKRAEAYEGFLNSIFYLAHINIGDDGLLYVHNFMSTKNVLSYYDSLCELEKNLLWITNNTGDIFFVYVNFLGNAIIAHKITDTTPDDVALVFAKDIHTELMDKVRVLQKELLKDLKDLYKTELFFNNEIEMLTRPQ